MYPDISQITIAETKPYASPYSIIMQPSLKYAEAFGRKNAKIHLQFLPL